MSNAGDISSDGKIPASAMPAGWATPDKLSVDLAQRLGLSLTGSPASVSFSFAPETIVTTQNSPDKEVAVSPLLSVVPPFQINSGAAPPGLLFYTYQIDLWACTSRMFFDFNGSWVQPVSTHNWYWFPGSAQNPVAQYGQVINASGGNYTQNTSAQYRTVGGCGFGPAVKTSSGSGVARARVMTRQLSETNEAFRWRNLSAKLYYIAV